MDGVQQVTKNFDVIEYSLRRVFTDIYTILKLAIKFLDNLELKVTHRMVLIHVFFRPNHMYSKMQYVCF